MWAAPAQVNADGRRHGLTVGDGNRRKGRRFACRGSRYQFRTYAKQDADAKDELHGEGLGFVDVYTNFGVTVQRIASRGPLNAPWGPAFAPASWGSLAGDLLVGNFGDGRINAYDGDHFDGQLRGTDGRPITIDGLWALLPGTASTGGVDTVWFSAGPNDENDGLVGQLTPEA